MKKQLLILPLILICHTLYAQKPYSLALKFKDCTDSGALILGTIQIWRQDNLIWTGKADFEGQAVIDHLDSGTYQLDFRYLYYPSIRWDVVIPEQAALHLCSSAGNTDSLIKVYKPISMPTLFLYGTTPYSIDRLNKVGKKYGVCYMDLGCVFNGRARDIDKYNAAVKGILTLRNGEGWEEKFWSEVRHTKN